MVLQFLILSAILVLKSTSNPRFQDKRYENNFERRTFGRFLENLDKKMFQTDNISMKTKYVFQLVVIFMLFNHMEVLTNYRVSEKNVYLFGGRA